jgi:hypothetical protein
MALTKDQIKTIVTSVGSHEIERPSTPQEVSSVRSRLWQAAKRNGNKVSCSITAEKFIVTVTNA